MTKTRVARLKTEMSDLLLISVLFIGIFIVALSRVESRISSMLTEERIRVCADITAYADDMEASGIKITPDHLREYVAEIERGEW